MKMRLMACLMAACMLMTMLAPVSGTLATEVEPTVAPEVTSVPTEEPVAPVSEDPTEQPVAPVSEEPTEEPAAPVSEDPTEEPAAPVSEEPTEQPTETPAEQPTETPAEEPTEVPTEQPTETPAEQPTETPAEEPTEVPTEEPEVAELSVSLSADRNHAFAGEDKIVLNATFGGGAAPYGIALNVNGKNVQAWTEIAEGGVFEMVYAPEVFGVHTFEVIVTDAQGAAVSAKAEVSVAVKESEKKEDWEKIFRDMELSGDWREDLIEIAKTQIGYEENEKDFIFKEDGQKQGYTRYGAWYGVAYEEWCAMFVSFCLNYAEIPEEDFPREAGCLRWVGKLNALGVYEDDEDEYEPQAGDLIFFCHEGDEDEVPSHVGIVENVDDSKVYTIEGNSAKAVRRCEYELDDVTIIGYANTAKLMDLAGVLPGEEIECDLTGKTVCTKVDGVELLDEAMRGGEVILTIESAGESMTVLGAKQTIDAIWYAVQYGENVGYVRGDLVVIEEVLLPEEEEIEPAKIGYEPWQSGVIETVLTYDVEGAVSYSWQRSAANAGEWEEILTTDYTDVLLRTMLDDLSYAYRCVATLADGTQVISDEITLIDAELAAWMNETEVTEEMLSRAMNTRSLDSLVIEGDKLVHVRTGKAVANYDAETGELRELDYNVLFGYLDMETLTIVPLADKESSAAPEVEENEGPVLLDGE